MKKTIRPRIPSQSQSTRPAFRPRTRASIRTKSRPPGDPTKELNEPIWKWWVDEALPAFVKKIYSPKENWKNKPFQREDIFFFFKGIEELSLMFTEDRPRGMSPYFQHPKFRSGYLLYFVPLQASKFVTLFQMYPGALEATLKAGAKDGKIVLADLGAGPGTGSIGFLLYLMSEYTKKKDLPELPPIEFWWFDTQDKIMQDGIGLVNQLAQKSDIFKNGVQVKTVVAPWWKAPQYLPNTVHLTLMGHVLNESSAPPKEAGIFWERIIHQNTGGGILLLEPAAKHPSQTLSRIRDHLFEQELLERSPTSIWGPCLHAGQCPLAEGRDWCHFSVPRTIPGRLFKEFSVGLGSEREWIKFSYLWFSSKPFPAPQTDPLQKLVVSDPIKDGYKNTLLLCEPEAPKRHLVKGDSRIRRGDKIRIGISHSNPKPPRPKSQ